MHATSGRAHTKRALALAVVAIAATGFGSSASGVEQAPTSPSAVLAKVDATLGSQNVYLGRGAMDGAEPGEDRTLSPYFYVAGGDPEKERLPLKATSAEVQIAGVIAKVKVHQVFENSGAKPIEAVYVFPASTRAAVHGMRMKIGKRTVEAKIERKQAAREQYEQAKQEGRRASLLEQQRPNVFTMNVANIMPRDRIEVELDYSELLVPEDATYEFVYPTVVGPRYGGGADPKGDKWIANPYLKEGEKAPYTFDIAVHVETAIPLKELASPSHRITVDYASPGSADVRLAEAGGGTKDFILRYRLAGDAVETGLLTWKGEKENFFLMMMEPPRRPTDAQMPPREYIFLLDVSGSMHGFPLDTAKALMNRLLSQLRPSDYFNVALFSGASYVMSPEGSLPATSGNIEHAVALIGRQRGGGGTELMGGLSAAYAIPKKVAGVSRSVVVVTDGYVGVEAQTFKFIRERLDQANVFSFGIGSSVNRALIEGMARAGQGEPFVVLRPEKAHEQAEKLREYIEKPVLSNIEVRFKDFAAYEVAPMKVPDLMARRPVVLFGKFRGEPTGKIELAGYSGAGRWTQSLDASPASLKAANGPLRWLWARRWVQLLDDEMSMAKAKELEDAITDLGLTYNLLTSFTSFVAVDSEIANRTGSSETVNQPLPLPDGVSNLAVGGSKVQGLGGIGITGSGSGGGGVGYGSGMGRGGAMREKKAQLYAAPAGPAAAPEGKMGAPMAPPPPMPAKPSSSHSLRRDSAKDEEEKAADRGTYRLLVTDYRGTGLDALKSLVDEIEKTLSKAQTCASKPGIVKLRLTLDKSGRVTKVDVLQSPDPAFAACLTRALNGFATSSKPTQDIGTIELTLKADPL